MFRSRRMFTFILIVSIFLLTSCIFPLVGFPSSSPERSTLEVDINYMGSWYRETFNYAREAENIHHLVLVLPEDQAAGVEPGWVFTSLSVEESGALTVREDRQEYAWALNYLHPAPRGYFSGKFAPGTYAVAVAFIANALSREEAGAGEDAVLWPGVTGGGASTGFEMVDLPAGGITSVVFDMTDSNGWACPWLYVFNGQTFERRTEILRLLEGQDQERTETTALGPVAAIDGAIVIRVAEEKREETFIDALYLMVDGRPIPAEATSSAVAAALSAVDGEYLILRQGEHVDLSFPVPASSSDGDSAEVVATGYYRTVP